MYETKKIKYNENEERRIMAVKHTTSSASEVEKSGVIYEVPMPIEGDEFQINGVIFKVNYQRDNPFRISAEPTGTVILEVIQNIIKSQEEPSEPKSEG